MTHPATERKQTIVDRLKGKSSKEDAQYRPAHERETKISCAECENYLFPGQLQSSCAKVAGVVEARDVCDLFEPRAAEYPNRDQGVSVKVTLNVQSGAK